MPQPKKHAFCRRFDCECPYYFPPRHPGNPPRAARECLRIEFYHKGSTHELDYNVEWWPSKGDCDVSIIKEFSEARHTIVGKINRFKGKEDEEWYEKMRKKYGGDLKVRYDWVVRDQRKFTEQFGELYRDAMIYFTANDNQLFQDLRELMDF